MVEVAYALSSEDHAPGELIRSAQAAEDAGFDRVWISDHYHPWTSAQGHSPFVWAVIGGIAATTELHVGTGVTCPTMRIHPAIVAQAAATAAVLLEGRFFLGVGSGEALNEHILGDRWPPADVRLEMLEESVAVLRLLWQGGQRSHAGRHYTVENARLWDLPDGPIPVHVSAFGPKAVALAARIGDGFVGTSPEPDLLQAYRSAGGKGPALAGAKCSWGPDDAAARRRVHDRWPNMGLPGELAQVLPTTAHMEQACSIVTEDMVADSIPTGPDPEPYVRSLQAYAEAGYDMVHLHSIGEDQEGFLRFIAEEVRPQLS